MSSVYLRAAMNQNAIEEPYAMHLKFWIALYVGERRPRSIPHETRISVMLPERVLTIRGRQYALPVSCKVFLIFTSSPRRAAQ